MSEYSCHATPLSWGHVTPDPFGRVVDYLRISITDRCNERCLYCMPEGYQGWRRQPGHLTADEIVRVVRVAAGMGLRKFRITGGEPLVRADALEIIRAITVIPRVDCVGLSTNGLRLAALAQPLREAGLRTVNVSLDALDAHVYRRITGGDIDAVLAGVHAAIAAGFERVKLNCVLMRGLNEQEIWPLVLFAAEHGLPLRFIELMPVNSREGFSNDRFLAIDEVLRMLRDRDELTPQFSHYLGWGPARYHLLKRTGALVGFIGAMTLPHFCGSCNRMRLTADGKIRPCLGDHGEIDLRQALRPRLSDEAVRGAFLAALGRKPLEQRFCGSDQPCRPMTAIGG